MPVVNATISAVFDEIADLLDIQGANPFRVRAYRNAARTVGDLGTDVKILTEQGTALTDIPGIGEDLANKINEIVETGRCAFLEKQRKEVPPAVTALLRVPGLWRVLVPAAEDSERVAADCSGCRHRRHRRSLRPSKRR